MNKTCYICGPMRGYPDFNFPEFDRARDRMKALGWNVVSPADLDREFGFNPNAEFTNGELNDCIKRDIDAVLKSDIIVLLDGWQHSAGATAEIAVAKWAGKSIREFRQYEA